MRQILFALLISVMLFSCEKEDLSIDTPSIAQTKSSDAIPDPLSQLKDIPVNIKVMNETEGRFLSSRKNDNYVSRTTIDDGSLRQRWYISIYPGAHLGPLYSIKVAGGAQVNGYISLRDGPEQFVPILNDAVPVGYRIENLTNTSNYNIWHESGWNNKLYLYTVGAGSALLFGKINNLDSRAIWEITPVEDLRLTDIKYIPVAGKKFEPTYMSRRPRDIQNTTNGPVEHTIIISEEVTETSHFSKIEGLNITNKVATKAKVGLPIITAEGEISKEHTTAKTWSYEESTTVETKRIFQDNFKIVVPPKTSYKIDVNLITYELDVMYVATFVGMVTGKIIQLKGKWTGVESSGIQYIPRGANGNPVKIEGFKTFKAL